jgi:hypothetical protein
MRAARVLVTHVDWTDDADQKSVHTRTHAHTHTYAHSYILGIRSW